MKTTLVLVTVVVGAGVAAFGLSSLGGDEDSPPARAVGERGAAVRLFSGRGVPRAQATQWIADANRIRAVIGC